MPKPNKPATGSAILPPPIGYHNRISRLGRELRREERKRDQKAREDAKEASR